MWASAGSTSRVKAVRGHITVRLRAAPHTVCVCVCACVCVCVCVCEKRANREPAFSHATAYVVVCELYVCPRATAHLSVRVVPRIEVHDSEDEERTGSRF